jgi:hypothetical protein
VSFPFRFRTSPWIFEKTDVNVMLLDSTLASYVSICSSDNNDMANTRICEGMSDVSVKV